ncbi:unnamed protein product, partial [Choristocarpus tenellus]
MRGRQGKGPVRGSLQKSMEGEAGTVGTNIPTPSVAPFLYPLPTVDVDGGSLADSSSKPGTEGKTQLEKKGVRFSRDCLYECGRDGNTNSDSLVKTRPTASSSIRECRGGSVTAAAVEAVGGEAEAGAGSGVGAEEGALENKGHEFENGGIEALFCSPQPSRVPAHPVSSHPWGGSGWASPDSPPLIPSSWPERSRPTMASAGSALLARDDGSLSAVEDYNALWKERMSIVGGSPELIVKQEAGPWQEDCLRGVNSIGMCLSGGQLDASSGTNAVGRGGRVRGDGAPAGSRWADEDCPEQDSGIGRGRGRGGNEQTGGGEDWQPGLESLSASPGVATPTPHVGKTVLVATNRVLALTAEATAAPALASNEPRSDPGFVTLQSTGLPKPPVRGHRGAIEEEAATGWSFGVVSSG